MLQADRLHLLYLQTGAVQKIMLIQEETRGGATKILKNFFVYWQHVARLLQVTDREHTSTFPTTYQFNPHKQLSMRPSSFQYGGI